MATTTTTKTMNTPLLASSPERERDERKTVALIKRAQGGDRKAADELMILHNGLVRQQACRYRIPGYDPDDMMQLGRMGLLRAIETFKPELGTKFSTIATLCIMSPMHHVLKSCTAAKRNKGQEPISLDINFSHSDNSLSDNKTQKSGSNWDQTILSCIADDAPGPEQQIIDQESYDRFVQPILDNVNHPSLSTILDRIGSGFSLSSIAREIGISRQALVRLIEGQIRNAAAFSLDPEATAIPLELDLEN